MGQPERQRHVGKPQVGQDQGKQQVEHYHIYQLQHHSSLPTIFIYFFLEQKKRRKNIFIYALTFLLLSTYNYQWLAVCVLSHGRRIANVDQIIGCDGQVQLDDDNCNIS